MAPFRFVWTAARMGVDALREGRLSMSPRRWLIDLRHLHRQMLPSALVSPPPVPNASGRSTDRDAFVREARVALTTFLASDSRIEFPPTEAPRLSILIVLFNQAELTLGCLRSIAAHVPAPFEVVIVDNGSSDETNTLLNRVDGAHVGRFGTNVGFLHGANTAALAARGDFLLFLNSDVELLPGAVASALTAIERTPEVGAVGGRLVFPDGRLQEAGSIIWRDGSCQGYGRGDQPEKAQYRFRRRVDFVSGAFLLTPRHVFHAAGGFDPAYSPAYYEDADYCVRLWKAGKQIIYDPAATVMHVEFGSSSAAEAAQQQQRHRAIFVTRHQDWVKHQLPRSDANVASARIRRGDGQRILVFDDRAPSEDMGFGFPRALSLLNALSAGGHAVTLYPTDALRADAGQVSTTSFEVLADCGPRQIKSFMDERRGHYDLILVSRAHNLELLRAKLGEPADWSSATPVMYDAEAISAVREAGRRRLAGEVLDDADVRSMIDAEIALARGVSAVIAASETEAQAFVARGATNVHVASFGISVDPTPAAFDERRDVLFVGSFDELSPNADAVLWFTRDVLPLVRARLQEDVRLVVVGRHAPASVLDLQAAGVDLCPNVVDLIPFYSRARVFVGPTRFAAGLPYKVVHAAAHGVPVAGTRLLRTQLGWNDGDELLSADTAEGFAEACTILYSDRARWSALRGAALRRVATDFSRDRFETALHRALSSCHPAP
jgi:GT2 family glycosyltransferase/glycosyltransferase involved in cell wall biosynthesis